MSTPPDTARPRLRAWGSVTQYLGRHGRRLTQLNIAAQIVIIVTGGAVRLTGSGLGCSTAPMCEPGQFLPDLSNLTLHTAIEFGNRLLSPVLVLIALATAIAVWHKRPELRWWGVVPLIGVLAQAVLGAITVRVQLHPLVVAPHLLISIALVWFSVYLALRYRRAPKRAGRCVKKPLRASAMLLVVVVVLGAFTTGSGPHSGDADVTERLNLDLERITQAHALAVWGYILMMAWVVSRVYRDQSVGDRDEVRRAWTVWVAIALAQGLIGYVQYFTGLPALIVGAHLAGAALLTAAHSAAYYLLRRPRRASA